MALYNYKMGQARGFPSGASGEEPTCQCRRHETQVASLGCGDPLEEGMALNSTLGLHD